MMEADLLTKYGSGLTLLGLACCDPFSILISHASLGGLGSI